MRDGSPLTGPAMRWDRRLPVFVERIGPGSCPAAILPQPIRVNMRICLSLLAPVLTVIQEALDADSQ
jgi:hypothetical protein